MGILQFVSIRVGLKLCCGFAVQKHQMDLGKLQCDFKLKLIFVGL